jgi:hypothetical protein
LDLKIFFWFPRAGVGTYSGRASVQFFVGYATLARRQGVPTPARGNEKQKNRISELRNEV